MSKIVVVEDAMEAPKLTDEQMRKLANPPQELEDKMGGTVAFREGDEVKFGPCRFRVYSFGKGAITLHAQPGTHITRRK